jgi:hypothetical protein
MRPALALTIRFTARAIAEALDRRRVARSKGSSSQGDDTTYSSDREVEQLVRELSSAESDRRGLEHAGEADNAQHELDSLLALDPHDPMARIERTLDLDRTERDLLRVVLAWSVEPRVGALIGHIHDALQSTRPTHGAIADILGDPLATAAALDPSRPLRRSGILEVERFGPDALIAIDARVALYVVTMKLSPLRVAAGELRLIETADLPPEAARVAERADGAGLVFFRGPPGSGRRSAALALAAREGHPALLLDFTGKEDATTLARIAARDARILGARLITTGTLEAPVAAELARHDIPLAITLAERDAIPEALHGRASASIDLAVPDVASRALLWAAALGRPAEDSEVQLIAERYAFTPGRIRSAAAQTRHRGLDAACRLHLRADLHGVTASSPSPDLGWDRLILPPAAMASMQAICAQVRHRRKVAETWGFGRHHSLGHGVKMLFFGKPGTGKTMAAEILGAELGMPLYRIDLARVVSKWIGETEQNLGRVFDEARESHGILFFDEADSLFARRTAVQSSTDRYANMEVNYLLQRVEEHDGLIVLATNFKSNLDEAFTRRLHFVVEFPDPDAAARERIWRLSIPPDAPVADDVDFAALARRFEISGGAIKNVVLGAAYLAAGAGDVIRTRHLGVALRRELTKMDRLYHPTEVDALADDSKP